MEDAYDREIRFWTIQAIIGGCVVFLAGTVCGVIAGPAIFQMKDWQTLLVGVLGAAVTLGSVLVVLLQIKSSRDQEEEKRLRRNLADRAQLAIFSIEALRNYERACITTLADLYRDSRGKPWSELTFTPPEYPSEFARQVAVAVESADIEDAFLIGWVCTQLQYQKYRLQDFSRRVSDSSPNSTEFIGRDIEYAVLHAIEINLLITDLAGYASSTKPIYLRKFDSGIYPSQLAFLGISETEWPEIYKKARHIKNAEGEYRGKGTHFTRAYTK